MTQIIKFYVVVQNPVYLVFHSNPPSPTLFWGVVDGEEEKTSTDGAGSLIMTKKINSHKI